MSYEYLTDEDYETAKANGISKKLAYQRFYYGGFTKERAITEPVNIYANQLWKEWKETAKAHGVSTHLFYKRTQIYVNKWTPEEAATHPPGTQIKKRKGRVTAEMYKQAEERGIGRATVHSRVYIHDWDPQKAITEPVDIRKRRKAN